MKLSRFDTLQFNSTVGLGNSLYLILLLDGIAAEQIISISAYEQIISRKLCSKRVSHCEEDKQMASDTCWMNP